jgi:hypothetical protein
MACANLDNITAACSLVSDPSGLKRLSPTPDTMPIYAAFSTFASFKSIKVTRPVIGVIICSYNVIAREEMYMYNLDMQTRRLTKAAEKFVNTKKAASLVSFF